LLDLNYNIAPVGLSGTHTGKVCGLWFSVELQDSSKVYLIDPPNLLLHYFSVCYGQ